MDLFTLTAKLMLDTTEYAQGIDNAISGAKNIGAGLSKAMSMAKGAFNGAVTVISTVSSVIRQTAGEVAVFGDKIDKASQKLGISAEAYQEWDAVLQHSGTSIDSLGMGMQTLANNAAAGAKEFAALGISQADALSREDLFEKTITGLQNITDENKRAQIAQKLFGRSAKELGPLLNTSAKETEAMRKRVHDLGGVMSNEAVKDSAAYQDALQDMTTAIDGAKRSLFSALLPTITKVMNAIANAAPTIHTIIDGVKTAYTTVVEPIVDSLLNTVIGEVGPKVMELLGNIGGALTRFMNGPGGAVVTWIVDKFMVAWDGMMTEMSTLLDFLNNVFSGNWEAAWQNLVDLVVGPFKTLRNLLVDPINAVIGIVNVMIDAVESAINGIIAGINSVIDKMPAMDLSEYGMPGMHKMPKLDSVSWGNIDHIKPLFNGGVLDNGERAIVGEFEPEFISMRGGRAYVQPSGMHKRFGGGREFTTQLVKDTRPIVLTIDGREFARLTGSYYDEEHIRKGVSLVSRY